MFVRIFVDAHIWCPLEEAANSNPAVNCTQFPEIESLISTQIYYDPYWRDLQEGTPNFSETKIPRTHHVNPVSISFTSFLANHVTPASISFSSLLAPSFSIIGEMSLHNPYASASPKPLRIGVVPPNPKSYTLNLEAVVYISCAFLYIPV